MKVSNHKFLGAIALTSLAMSGAILTGCGNNGKATNTQGQTQFLQAGGKQFASTGGAQQPSCPYTPNIQPKQEWFYDGADYYRGCVGSNNADVYIQGKSRTGEEICVFPAEQGPNSAIAHKPDLETGFPLSECKPGSDTTPVQFSFAGISYNYVFVVNKSLKQQMERCLALGNYYACPITYPYTFSYGRFR